MMDLISRKDAIEAINRVNESHMNITSVPLLGWCTLLDEIKSIPSIQPKRGEWKRRIVDGGWNANLVCSECGYTLMIETGYNYCPNCGADMREKDGDSE